MGKRLNWFGKVILLGDISIIPSRNFEVKEIDSMKVKESNSLKVNLKTEKLEVKKITGGIVRIYGSEYQIYRSSKPRNPDGSVHHTTLELM